MAANSLKGSIKMAPMILKTTPSVKPTMAKGRSKNQTNINKKNKPTASGQHRANKIQNNRTAIKNFIALDFF